MSLAQYLGHTCIVGGRNGEREGGGEREKPDRKRESEREGGGGRESGGGGLERLVVCKIRNGRLFRKYEMFDCTNTEEESKGDICLVRST